MAVYVNGRLYRSMAKLVLDVVQWLALLQEQAGECMPYIMYPGLGHVSLFLFQQFPEGPALKIITAQHFAFTVRKYQVDRAVNPSSA
jgi:hypothetical protein